MTTAKGYSWLLLWLSLTPLCLVAATGSGGKAAPSVPDAVTQAVQFAHRGELDLLRGLIARDIDLNGVDGRGYTPLLGAVAGGKGAAAELLLGAGADPNIAGKGMAPLWAAAFRGDRSMVQLLLHAGGDLAKARYNNLTPFQAALYKGHEAVALDLLALEPEWQRPLGVFSPLMQAAGDGMVEMTTALLAQGADPNQVSGVFDNGVGIQRSGVTALMLAAAGGHGQIVGLLLNQGADPDLKDSSWRSTLQLAAEADHPKVVQLLLESGAQWPAYIPPGEGSQSQQLLADLVQTFKAAEAGEFAPVQRFIKQYPQLLRLPHPRQGDLLTVSAVSGHTALVALLLKEVVDPQPALAPALAAGQRATAIQLMERGAVLPVPEGDGWPMRMLIADAVQAHDHLFLQTAVAAGWNPSLPLYGQLPLNLAIESGDIELVLLLLDAGADADSTQGNQRPLMNGPAREQGVIQAALIDRGARYREDELWSVKGHYFNAVEKSDLQWVDRYLRAEVPVDLEDYSEGSALLLATRLGHHQVVGRLLEGGADIHRRNSDGYGALHLAASGGHQAVMAQLLAAGLGMDGGTPEYGTTPLIMATINGQATAANWLVGQGAAIDQADSRGKTALAWAVDQRQVTMVEALLQLGANPDRANERGETPLMTAIDLDQPELVDLLLAAGSDVKLADQAGDSALKRAYQRGDADLFSRLAVDLPLPRWLEDDCLEALDRPGFNRDTLDFCATIGTPRRSTTFRQQALLKLAASRSEKLLERLLSAGAEVDGSDEVGRTPLMLAAMHNPGVMTLLITAGADINRQDRFGQTALGYLLEGGVVTAESIKPVLKGLQQLIEQPGFSPPADDLLGLWGRAVEQDAVIILDYLLNQQRLSTPAMAALEQPLTADGKLLSQAITGGHRSAFQFLLASGALLTRHQGQLALPHLLTAIDNAEWDYAGQLLQAGVVADSYDQGGRTPLLAAIRAGNPGFLQQLLSVSTIDPDRPGRDGEGLTPLMLASRQGDLEAVQLLLAAGATVGATVAEGDNVDALMLAVQAGQLAVVEQLLAANADPQVKSSGGETLLQMLPAAGGDALRQRLETAMTQASATSPRPVLTWSTEGFDFIDSATLSDDGRLLVVSSGRSLRLLEASSGRLIRTLEYSGHPGDAPLLFAGQDQRIVMTSSRSDTAGSLVVWGSRSGQALLVDPLRPEGEGHRYRYLASALAGDGESLFTLVDQRGAYRNSLGQRLIRWDLRSGQVLASWPVVATTVKRLAVTTDGRLVAATAAGAVALWTPEEAGHLSTQWLRPSVMPVPENAAGVDGSPPFGREACCIALSVDGALLAVDTPDGAVEVYRLSDGELQQQIAAGNNGLTALGFDRGNRLYLGRQDGAVESWGDGDDRVIEQPAYADDAIITRFAPDAAWAFQYALPREQATARIIDIAAGRARLYESTESVLTATALSASGSYLASGAGSNVELINLGSGRRQQLLRGEGESDTLAFSSDGRWLATGPNPQVGSAENRAANLWDLENGRLLRRFPGGIRPTFSSDGKALVVWQPNGEFHKVGADDVAGTIQLMTESYTPLLWDLAEERVIAEYPRHITGHSGEHLALPGGRMLSHLEGDDVLVLWRLADGEVLQRYDPAMRALAPGPDDNSFITARMGTLIQIEIESGQVLHAYADNEQFAIPDAIIPQHQLTVTALSTGRQLLAAADRAGRIMVLDLGRGEVIQRLADSDGYDVTGLGFVAGDRYLFSSTSYGARRFWDLQTGKVVATLLSFVDDRWVVVDADGRYDSNQPGDIPALSWVFEDDPLTPLPLELFIREYYEPGLLGRLLAGERFPPIKPIADLNRVQPVVRISEVSSSVRGAGYVDITVELAAGERSFIRDGEVSVQGTAVHDLQLFRDGRLVRYAPAAGGEVKLDREGQRTLKFDGIPLPSDPAAEGVLFSAYAFNDDRIKSPTHRLRFKPEVKGGVRTRRAYVIAIGANAYENPSWNLRYAANDARAILDTLVQRLEKSGSFDQVIPVSLVADWQQQAGVVEVTEKLATRAAIGRVLGALAGKVGATDALSGVINADRLQQATPDDTLIITFSGHGLAAPGGNFHFFTYDTGPGESRQVDQAFLDKTLSSGQLANWLRDVDAGQMLMVIDACNSAASVADQGFKPGPMGSRGLGQLAYDKGMRVLTASQAEAVALESSLLQHGMLTYALIQDGIRTGAADHQPKDRQITAREWLDYGERRVPQLYAQLAAGDWRPDSGDSGDSRGQVVYLGGRKPVKPPTVQRPHLFDFVPSGEDWLLVDDRGSPSE